MAFLRASLLLLLSTGACTDITYGSGDAGNAGGAGGEPAGAGGVGPSSGGGPVGGSGGAGASGGQGAAGAGGEGGCLGPDACDGTDGDCDGWADDPPGDTGFACDCYWGAFEGRRYVACPFASTNAATCPSGMQIAVPQTEAEQDFIGNLGPPTLARVWVGLTQADGSTSPAAGWSWDRPGVPISWALGEPNDWASTKPPFLENGFEQCADIQGSNGVNDNYCANASLFLACEEIAPECVDGAPCALALGCPGVFDCDAASPCVPSPEPEECNGRDDACLGVLDEDDACDCSPLGASYKVCGPVTSILDAHCGPGWALATLSGQSEFSDLLSQLPPAERFLIGLGQLESALDLGDGWTDRDGASPTGLPSFWLVDEPNDDDFEESHLEDCAAIAFGGLIDQPCEGVPAKYLCEID